MSAFAPPSPESPPASPSLPAAFHFEPSINYDPSAYDSGARESVSPRTLSLVEMPGNMQRYPTPPQLARASLEGTDMGGDGESAATMAAAAAMNTIKAVQQKKSAKSHVASACANCKKAHLACDGNFQETKADLLVSRPCKRCFALDKADSCVDVQHKKRGRPRLRDERSFSSYGEIPSAHMQTIPLTQQGQSTFPAKPLAQPTMIKKHSLSQQLPTPPLPMQVLTKTGRVLKPIKIATSRSVQFERRPSEVRSPEGKNPTGGYFDVPPTFVTPVYSGPTSGTMQYSHSNLSPKAPGPQGSTAVASATLFTTATDLVIARLVEGVSSVLGWNPEDLERSRSFFDLCHPADRSALTKMLQGVHAILGMHDPSWTSMHPETTLVAVARHSRQDLLASLYSGSEQVEHLHVARKDGTYLRARVRAVLGMHASLCITITPSPSSPITWPVPHTAQQLSASSATFPPTPRQSFSSASTGDSMDASYLRHRSLNSSVTTMSTIEKSSPRPSEGEMKLPPIKDMSLSDKMNLPPRRGSMGIHELLQ